MNLLEKRILFVCRQKSNGQASPIVQAQHASLQSANVDVFLIRGKGLLAYFKSIPKLRKFIKTQNIDIIHAHYSFSGYAASLSLFKPVVCSLMGSDVQAKGIKKGLLRFFALHIWDAVVVKSKPMAQNIGLESAHIIPNGVNFSTFRETDRQEASRKTGFDRNKHNILFLADPARPEKNYNLASEAVNILADQNIVLTAIHGIDHNEIPHYLSAADILLLTSKWEGSPNAVKEAMACNCPMVSTDVGDVKEIIGDTEGCYITSFEAEDVAAKLKLALDFGKRTKGREKIQHLDSTIIAERLIEVYKQVLNK